MIDNTSCLNTINTIKSYVNNCFSTCASKGSTFSGIQKLYNLEQAISLIPSGSGGISENITGASFTPFNVTWAEVYEGDNGLVYPSEFTIDFGAIGVTWKSLVCYSDTRDGHFSIQKISNNKCIISANTYVDGGSDFDNTPSSILEMSYGTFRASYTISGNNIVFTADVYSGFSNGAVSHGGDFRDLPSQVCDTVNDYYRVQYKLDKITVCV